MSEEDIQGGPEERYSVNCKPRKPMVKTYRAAWFAAGFLLATASNTCRDEKIILIPVPVSPPPSEYYLPMPNVNDTIKCQYIMPSFPGYRTNALAEV